VIVQLHIPATLLPRKKTLVFNEQKVVWHAGTVWILLIW